MVISDYITPVMMIDPTGEIALLVILIYAVVITLFTMSTYALIEESRPLLDPIMKNISFSFTAGTGQGASIAKVGIFAGAGMSGYVCDATSCRMVNSSGQLNIFLYSFTSQYENGMYKTYEGWGFGPIMGMTDGEKASLYLLIDLSTNLTPSTTVSFQVNIDIAGVIDGYWQLIKGAIE